MPGGISPPAVGSYPAFSPLPLARRFVFCCTFRTPSFAVGAPAFQPEFRSAVSGLSSRAFKRANVCSAAFLIRHFRRSFFLGKKKSAACGAAFARKARAREKNGKIGKNFYFL